MNRILGVARLQLRDRTLLYMPWLIVLISFVVNLLISAFLRNEVETMYSGGVASLYVYMLVAGMVVLPQTFAFSLGFGVRRKDYFLGTAAVIAATSVLFALILLLLSIAEGSWTNGWGVDLRFFHLPYLNDGPFWVQLWVFFACLLHLFYLGFALSSVHRRFGKTGLWTVLLTGFALLTFGSYMALFYGWWGAIFQWFARHTMFELSLYAFAGAVVYAAISYGMLRRATV